MGALTVCIAREWTSILLRPDDRRRVFQCPKVIGFGRVEMPPAPEVKEVNQWNSFVCRGDTFSSPTGPVFSDQRKLVCHDKESPDYAALLRPLHCLRVFSWNIHRLGSGMGRLWGEHR